MKGEYRIKRHAPFAESGAQEKEMKGEYGVNYCPLCNHPLPKGKRFCPGDCARLSRFYFQLKETLGDCQIQNDPSDYDPIQAAIDRRTEHAQNQPRQRVPRRP